MAPRDLRRRLGNALIVIGLITLLVMGGCAVRGLQDDAGLRSPLPDTPAAATTVAAVSPASSAPVVTVRPSPAAGLATQPVLTAAPTPVSAATEEPAPLEATPQAPPAPGEDQPPLGEAPALPEPVAAGSPPVRLLVDLPGQKIDAEVVEMGWQVIETAGGPRAEWLIPKNEAGHHLDSARPGEIGNVVISGHNNIYGQVLRPISLAWDDDSRVKVDDVTDSSDVLNGRAVQLIDAAGRTFDYVITHFYRLKDTGASFEQRVANARFMKPTEDSRLTLITCWPPTSNTHRLIVIAEPAQQSEVSAAR